jgi:phosphohistidine phosphatase SixA
MYMRHAHADVGSDQHANKDYWKDCALQRRISDRGMIDANTVGVFIRAHNLPIARVVASPLCRAQRTAELLKLGAVETAAPLSDYMTWLAMGNNKKDLLPAFRKELSKAIPSGKNVMVVAHAQRGSFIAHPVFDLIEMRTIAVFRAKPDEQLELLGTIEPKDWQYLGVAEIPSIDASTLPR